MIHQTKEEQEILYIDMDNVLVDFPSAFPKVAPELLEQYANDKDEIPGIFELMDPMRGAIDAYHQLAAVYDTYILSTSPWKNPEAAMHKIEWVHKHLPEVAHKRLILSHNKHLNRGDYLIDDRPNNGAEKFEGEWIHFGQAPFENWEQVLDHLL